VVPVWRAPLTGLEQCNAALGLHGDALEPGLESIAKAGDVVIEIVEDAFAVVEAEQPARRGIGRDAAAEDGSPEQHPRSESSCRKWSTTPSFSAIPPGKQWST
jgi:hypothetical protein